MKTLNKLSINPSPARFARMVVKALRNSGFDAPTKIDHERFCIRTEHGHLYLHNLHTEYRRGVGRDRKRVIQDVVQVFKNLTDGPVKLDDARDHLLPRIHCAKSYSIGAISLQRDGVCVPDIPTKKLSDHLAVALCIDQPQTVATVLNRGLADWGIDFEEGLKIARANLWALSNKDFRRIQPGLYAADWFDSHDASRMYLHDLIWQLEVRGQHVVIAADQNHLFVTGSEDADGLREAAELATKVLDEYPRWISGIAHRLEGTQWQPFMVPREHPSYFPLHSLATKTLA